MNIKEKEYLKEVLIQKMDNINQALDNNMLFYMDDLEYAYEELEIINSILKKV